MSDELGAKMEVGIQLRAELSNQDLRREQIKTRVKVKACTQCPLHEGCAGPAPMAALPCGRAELLVVGEAPGAKEDELGRPFVGPAGRLLRAMLSEAGFDLDQVAFCNVVSCYPRRDNVAPSRQEMTACRANLRDQVVASGATYIVLAGSVATQSWRSDLRLSDIHGQVFLWGNSWVIMPIFHPAAILRDRMKKVPTQTDLNTYFEVVAEDKGLTALGVHCVKCHDDVSHYDPDGVPWCERHWMRHGGQWKREWAKWSNDKAAVTLRLL